jgi:hypothetical protein
MTLADFEPPFDSICKDLKEVGGTLYESSRPYMREQWGDWPLTIDFIDSPHLNAIATVDDGQYRICIFRGAVEHVYGAMYGLMSCPSFLPAIGNAKGETPPAFFPESGFCPIPTSQAAPLYTGVEIVIPTDPTRRTAAMLLASVALEFLVVHEVGHIVGGHLEIEPTASIREYEGGVGASGTHALDRALECDADAFACHATGSIVTHPKMASTIQEIVRITRWPDSQVANVLYFAAIAVLFRILYPRAPANIGPPSQSHPHPAIRAAIASVCTGARSMHDGQLSPDALGEVFSSSLRNVEELWVELRLPGQVLQPETQWAESVIAGMRELLDAYESHRVLLNQHSHLDRRWHDWEWRVGDGLIR